MRLALEQKEALLSDPARFAQAIREIAYETHRTLKHSPSRAALRRLARRINILSAVLQDRQDVPLQAWLENAGREVRYAAAHQARSSRPTCLCACTAARDLRQTLAAWRHEACDSISKPRFLPDRWSVVTIVGGFRSQRGHSASCT